MPALLGSLAGLLLAGLAEEKSGSMQVLSTQYHPNFPTFAFTQPWRDNFQYGVLLYSLYPGRTPPETWTCLKTNSTMDEVLLVCSSSENLQRSPSVHSPGRKCVPCFPPTSTCPGSTGLLRSRSPGRQVTCRKCQSHYYHYYHQAVTLLATLGLAALSGTMAGMAVKYLDQC